MLSTLLPADSENDSQATGLEELLLESTTTILDL